MSLILLDRDGVINKDLPTSVRTVEDFELLPGVGEAISRLNMAGHRVVVITNQAVVGRGDITQDDLGRIHEEMKYLLSLDGAHVDDIIFCTDFEPSPRRKPAPGMLLEALEKYGADPASTPFVGDALRDLQAAEAVGCMPVLVKTGKGEKTLKEDLPQDVQVFDDLSDFVEGWLAKS